MKERRRQNRSNSISFPDGYWETGNGSKRRKPVKVDKPKKVKSK